MIVDCFQYNNEVDLLRLRLGELSPVVDKFVVCYASVDHQGNPARIDGVPQDLLNQYPIEVIYAMYPPTLPPRPDCLDHCAGYQSWKLYCSFMIEHWHREYLHTWAGISLQDDDIMMISDCDEIPARQVVADPSPGVVFMHSYYYKLNLLAQEPIVGTIKFPWWWLKGQTLQSVREQRYQVGPRLEGGWHFSWLAHGVEDVLRKFDMIAHVELATPENRALLPERYAQRQDPFGRHPDRPLRALGLEHLPFPVRENPSAWQALLDLRQ